MPDRMHFSSKSAIRVAACGLILMTASSIWHRGSARPDRVHASSPDESARLGPSQPIPGSHEFAWNLFHAFLTEGEGERDWGSWSTWRTKSQLCFGTGALCEQTPNADGSSLAGLMQGHLALPVQAMQSPALHASLRNSDKSGRLPYATILYNSIASRFIESNVNQPAMKALLANKAQDIPAFPDGSIVIKTFWELVQNSPDALGSESINVWDPGNRPPLRPANRSYGAPTQWTNSILYVDLSAPTDCTAADIDLATGPRPGLTGQSVVPLGCFYHVKVTGKNWESVEAGMVPSVHPKEGDYIVLLGVHILKKVDARWIWSTFWWTNRPGSSSADFPSYSDRPTGWDVRWSHYVMNTADAVLNSSLQRNLIFNPYIEGSGANAPVSNCILCHGWAAYNARLPMGEALGSPDSNGNFPNGTIAAKAPTYFNQTVRTDYLWSVIAPSSTQRPAR